MNPSKLVPLGASLIAGVALLAAAACGSSSSTSGDGAHGSGSSATAGTSTAGGGASSHAGSSAGGGSSSYAVSSSGGTSSTAGASSSASATSSAPGDAGSGDAGTHYDGGGDAGGGNDAGERDGDACPTPVVCAADCVAGKGNVTTIVDGCTITECCVTLDAGACGSLDDAGDPQSGACPEGQFCCNEGHTGALAWGCLDLDASCIPTP